MLLLFITPVLMAVFAVGFAWIWHRARATVAGLFYSAGYAVGAAGFSLEILGRPTEATPLIAYAVDVMLVSCVALIVVGTLTHHHIVKGYRPIAVVWTVFVVGQAFHLFNGFENANRSFFDALAVALVLGIGAFLVSTRGKRNGQIASWAFGVSALIMIVQGLAVKTVMHADVNSRPITDSAYAELLFLLSALITAAMGCALMLGLLMDQLRSAQAAAAVDPLTGLLNRRGVEARLRRLEESACDHCLIVVDVDRFKIVNDTHGHSAGDQILQELVRRLGHTQRSSDILGRLGGEEFCVILPDAPMSVAKLLAERMRLSIETNPMAARDNNGDQHRLHITASFGVTCFNGVDDFADALRRSDEALYRAKGGGRNRVCATKCCGTPDVLNERTSQMAASNVVRLRA